jgi:hypothetical protein
VIRVVEAQHKISTSRLAEGLLEEEILEQYVEAAKPGIPPAARGLHRLLATPFRFGHRKETRFRRSHERPGVFYASERARTALAEQAYWFMRFHMGTPSARLPTGTIEYWAYSIAVGAQRVLDLTLPPYAAARTRWSDPDNYIRCQEFAARARAIDAQLIRYESVRDPEKGANVALFDPSAFREKVPKDDSSWHFRFHGSSLMVFRAFPSEERYEFTFGQFGLTAP